MVLYEQCVRTFWHDEHYKDDLRFLKVWLEYVRGDPRLIFFSLVLFWKVEASHVSV